MSLSRTLDRLWPKWHDWVLLTRLDKPIGSYLLLWPTLWALWVAADGMPSFANLVIFVLGVFVMRSAGCVINDYADRHVDRHVERTRQRPLTQGRLSEKEALTGFVVLCLTGLVLVLFTNLMTILLSFGAVILAAIYPFMKRHTHLPQVFLGAAFSWAIPMAFAAESETLPTICWLLYIANLTWTVGYDTMYAMVDRDDDLKIGIKSTAVLFAELDLLMIGLLYVLTAICLLLVASLAKLAWPFYLAWLVGSAYMGWQVWSIRSRDRMQCFRAFRLSHWYGFIILLGIVASTGIQ